MEKQILVLNGNKEEKKKKYDINKLCQIFNDSKSCDDHLFNEQRANHHLYVSDHFKSEASYLDRKTKTPKKKKSIQFVNNHIATIARYYENQILDSTGDVHITALDKEDLREERIAQHLKQIWKWIKSDKEFKNFTESQVNHFVVSGECFAKITWDPTGGSTIDRDRGLKSGGIDFEVLFPWDVYRDTTAKSWKEVRHVVVNKMVSIDTLRDKLKESYDEEEYKEIDKALCEESDETFMIYSDKPRETKDQVNLREFYFKPCKQYPKGYWAFATKTKILFEGEFDSEELFPIVYAGFNPIVTCPRAYSPIHDWRNIQYRINQLSGAYMRDALSSGKYIAVHKGQNCSIGSSVDGTRILQFSGPKPTVIETTAGDKFINGIRYLESTLYKQAHVSNLLDEKQSTGDIMADIHKAAREKKFFHIYAQRFQNFMHEVTCKALTYAQTYISDELMIDLDGLENSISIPLFKSITSLDLNVEVKQSGASLDTMMGKQLALTNVLQYVQDLDPSTRHDIITSMPLLANSGLAKNIKQEETIVENKILLLQQGGTPMITESENHALAIKMLNSEINKVSFQHMPEQIRENYLKTIQAHEQMLNLLELRKNMLNEGMIPFEGNMVPLPIYESTPTERNPNKVSRVQMEISALYWLLEKRNQQGQFMQSQQGLNDATLANLGDQVQLQQQFEQQEQQQQLQMLAQQQMSGGNPLTNLP